MAEKIIVPLLDLKAQYAEIRDDIAKAIDEVVSAQYFIMGPNVKALEEEIAAYCRTTFAVGCASGSDAILLALMALDVGKGDEVICPAYTFFSTAGSIYRLGARPVFADIDPVTYNIDPGHVRELAGRCGKLKAIMPVHLFGQAADMDALLAIADEVDVPVIEDAAQAIGTEDATGARAGSRGAVGCFSFYPSKNLGAFGDGGICTMNDAAIADRIGILRVHGAESKYHHKVVGLNSRLDALQAAILRVKLKYLDRWTEGRRRNAAHYDEAFAAAGAKTSARPLDEEGLPLRTPAPAAENARHIYNQYVIRVPGAIREALRQELSQKGIGTEIYYPVPLHLQECFADLGYGAGDLPHSEQAAAETIALPIYPELTERQCDHVVQTTVNFVGRHAAVRA